MKQGGYKLYVLKNNALLRNFGQPSSTTEAFDKWAKASWSYNWQHFPSANSLHWNDGSDDLPAGSVKELKSHCVVLCCV